MKKPYRYYTSDLQRAEGFKTRFNDETGELVVKVPLTDADRRKLALWDMTSKTGPVAGIGTPIGNQQSGFVWIDGEDEE